MIPCLFSDLGKKARDLFDKNFVFDMIKIKQNTSPSDCTDIVLQGSHAIDKGTVSGDIEIKYKIKDWGLVLSEKCTTGGQVTAKAELDDKLVDGLKNSFEFTINPSNMEHSAKLVNRYKRPYFHGNLDLHAKESHTPMITLSGVLGCEVGKGYLFGCEVGYDANKQKLEKYNYALGYDTDKLILHAAILSHNNIEASVYQKINDKLETGVKAGYDRAKGASTFALVGQYQLDDGKSTIKAKVDTKSVIGLSYGVKVSDGTKLYLCGQINGANLNGGQHQLGCCIEFDV